MSKTAITPTREEDYPEWYQQVVKAADLAENSPVRGCMVIKPWGYAIWENMQKVLDKKFKDTGHKNAYFPLFIPKSYLEKEAQHVDGFAKECAVITHSRLEAGEDGKLHPASPLEEPLIVRPTSETIIGETFSKWVQSHRDLPLLINQWANVVRWEMRTRLFLRTSEFLWQEGHTAHATKEEAIEETLQMLGIYTEFAEKYIAMPVIKGEKTESERFPGAENTYTFEAMMQDGKALQAGTSHFLGQKFARAFDIKFQNKDEVEQYAWTTSWGVTTRLIGALVMTHSDDDGLILPPRLAPTQVVILPVLHKEETREEVLSFCKSLKVDLEKQTFFGQSVEVEIDDRDIRGGDKTWQWIKKGVPIRVEVGPRDIAQNSVFVARRDKGVKEKESINRDEFVSTIGKLLEEMQNGLFERAKSFRDAHIFEVNSKDKFYEFFEKNKKGFVSAHWNGSREVEEQIKKDLSVTIRCIPSELDKTPGTCIFSGEPSPQRVIFAKAY